MARLIDAGKLYEQIAELEAEALAYVKKLDPKEDYEKWLRWTVTLFERTAFKHDVADAPTADSVRHGAWIWDDNGMDWGIGAWICSTCHCRPETTWQSMHNIVPHRWSGSHYCPNCGTKMDLSDTNVGKTEDER